MFRPSDPARLRMTTSSCSRRRRGLRVLALLSVMVFGAAGAGTPTPWLDVPAAWARHVEGGVVSVMPGDLAEGRSLLLMVEPAKASKETLQAAYEGALRDLGPWEPIGSPTEQAAGGWTYLQGVGVATLNGARLIGHTVVALKGGQRVRLWALADSDTTYNRYKAAITTAIESVQDIGKPPAVAAAGPQSGATASVAGLPAGFGQGISGVYVGVDRGVSAGAGIGHQATTQVGDALEVDVFFADGSYRRRLPVRGLLSDLAWDREQQPNLWGRWQQQGRQQLVQRGGHSASYTVDGQGLMSDRGRPWAKLTPHSGTRLNATFARADYRDAAAPRLTLRADGSYEDRGDFMRMVGSAWHLVEPDADAMRGRWNDAQFKRAMAASSGSYSFDQFTLTLRSSDGRVWQVNAYVPAGDAPPRPQRLVINGRMLARE